MHNDYSLTFPPLSIARYSFVQLSQLGRQWRELKCQHFETVAKGDSNSGTLDRESGILPRSTQYMLIVVVVKLYSSVLEQVKCFDASSHVSDHVQELLYANKATNLHQKQPRPC